MTRRLTSKQQTFVAEYLIDLNATKAAERAGYSKRTARSIGQENLTKPDIQLAIAEAQAERMARLNITAEGVLRELAFIAFANMLDYIRIENGQAIVDLSALTRDQAAAIGEISVEEVEDVRRTRFKLKDKRAALVDLGRHLKLFMDRTELKGSSLSIKDLSDQQLKDFLAAIE